MTDDKDIERQCRMMYMQVNILLRKFSFCSDEVKVSLFKAYRTPLYAAHLWCNYRASSLQKLQVAYNDAMRILLRRPRWHGACEICVSVREITLKALLRNLMYRFICRLNASINEIIVGLSNIGLVHVSVKVVETLVLLYFVTLISVIDAMGCKCCLLSFLNLDLESVIKFWLIN